MCHPCPATKREAPTPWWVLSRFFAGLCFVCPNVSSRRLPLCNYYYILYTMQVIPHLGFSLPRSLDIFCHLTTSGIV